MFSVLLPANYQALVVSTPWSLQKLTLQLAADLHRYLSEGLCTLRIQYDRGTSSRDRSMLTWVKCVVRYIRKGEHGKKDRKDPFT